MLRTGIALLLSLLATCGGAIAATRAPDAVTLIERASLDDPEAVLREPVTDEGAPEQRLQALVQRVLALGMLERYDETAAVLPAARELATRLGDKAMQCLIDTVVIGAMREREGWQATQIAAEDAMQAARKAGLAWCVPRLQIVIGRIHTDDGRRAAAVEALQAAAGALEAEDDRLMLALARNYLAWTYRKGEDDGAIRRAIQQGEAALAGFDQEQHRYLAAGAHHNLAGALLVASEWEAAGRHAALAERYARAIGDTHGLAYIGRLQGQVELKLGRAAVALRFFEDARRVFQTLGPGLMVVHVGGLEAEALLALGRAGAAARVLAEVEPVRARINLATVDVDHFKVVLDVSAAAHDAAGVVRTARAYADALRRRERDENRRIAAEMEERYANTQRETENRLLRGEQEVQRTRLLALGGLLALAALLVVGLTVHLVQQRRLRAQLKRLAEVDELTGLPNRRTILALLRTVAGSRRRDEHAIAMLDIDHFKRVNDRHGHAVGDAALVVFAKTCQAVLREGDAVGRLGGEEFLVVLRHARAAELQPFFDRLRAGLRASPVPGMPADERLSCSMGVADVARGGDVDVALRCADEALYRAKAAGRDRMELATAPC